ncbi:MAG: V-type ATPase 116kDa subunit family protein [Acutalibacteraceae bacterium]|nr:V-type ATPase 116kDa subunit family protein [Acutalibacteraceae bacterium]
MSVSPMKVIDIIGLREDLDEVIKVLGDSQAFQPEPVSTFYPETGAFVNSTDANPYSELLLDFYNSLSFAQVEPKFQDISEFEVTDDKLFGYSKAFVEEMQKYSSKISEIETAIEKCEKSIEQTSHFVDVDLEMKRVKACEYIKPCFGRMPLESVEKLKNYKNNPYITFFTASVDKDYCWGVYMAPIDNAEEVDHIFTGLFFERFDITDIEGTPKEYIKQKTEEKLQLTESLKTARDELKAFINDNFKEAMLYYTKLAQQNVYQEIRTNVMFYKGNKNSFVLCGWLPADKAEKIGKKLDKIKSVEWHEDDAANHLDKSPPIKLKYNWLSKPYKFYVEMYGMPAYNEIDPSTFVAITYTILFGAMFGDFGHGIILAIAGAIMYKLKGMAVGKVLVPCGIVASLFGVLFGSVFGFEEAFNGFYQTVFGLEEKPIHVMGSEGIITIILASVAVGVLIVILCMCLNIYTSFRQKNMAKALFGSNGIAGLVLYSTVCGGIALLLVMGINIFNFITVPLLILLPLVLIFLAEPLGDLVEGKKDWKPESWGGYFTQNFFEMFEVILSYLSNTMSFLRVGAFIMVHAGLMMVVFILIELVGGPTSVVGIIILVAGNLFVIALEGLLVSIQTLRLEFYEIFSRFYSGSGRPYTPACLENHILKNK